MSARLVTRRPPGGACPHEATTDLRRLLALLLPYLVAVLEIRLSRNHNLFSRLHPARHFHRPIRARKPQPHLPRLDRVAIHHKDRALAAFVQDRRLRDNHCPGPFLREDPHLGLHPRPESTVVCLGAQAHLESPISWITRRSDEGDLRGEHGAWVGGHGYLGLLSLGYLPNLALFNANDQLDAGGKDREDGHCGIYRLA